MARDVRKTRWSRHAVRLVSYVNFRWSLATIGPRLGLTGLLLSLLLVLGRRAAVETLTLALAAIAVFVSVLLVSQARLWRTRYRLRDAWSRLDHDLQMHGALLSAVEGVTPWPKPPERGVRLKADAGRARTGLGAALSEVVSGGSATPTVTAVSASARHTSALLRLETVPSATCRAPHGQRLLVDKHARARCVRQLVVTDGCFEIVLLLKRIEIKHIELSSCPL